MRGRCFFFASLVAALVDGLDDLEVLQVDT